MEYQEFGDLESGKNYQILKEKLGKALAEADRAPDLRAAKDTLIKVQAEFKGLKLHREDREELHQRLQLAFEKINQQIEQERHAFTHEALGNYSELKLKVEEAIYQAGKAGDWREAKKYLIDVQQEFRGLKLIKENREELYAKLQAAFTDVNLRQEEEMGKLSQEASGNYGSFRPVVENALDAARHSENYQETWDHLIGVQNEFRQVRLLKEQRESLYQLLQEAFATLKSRREEDKEKMKDVAGQNYEHFSVKVKEVMEMAAQSAEFKPVREKLKDLQAELRDSHLLREQKDELYAILQEAFTLLNMRQDEERKVFESEAITNYERLKKLVNNGLQQANDSIEYKETREFLKKIQAEFKGIRMVREQREELYSRLQSAFDVLQHRMDTFFREKKKNWEVYMQFKLKDLSVTISEIEKEIEKQEDHLSELETQLDILGDNPKERDNRTMLTAKIQSVENSILRSGQKLLETEREMANLKQRLGDDVE